MYWNVVGIQHLRDKNMAQFMSQCQQWKKAVLLIKSDRSITVELKLSHYLAYATNELSFRLFGLKLSTRSQTSDSKLFN